MNRYLAMIPLIGFLLGLFGCDAKRIERLEAGVSTEVEVRQQFGEPQAVYAEPGGGKTFEYSRQPEGQVAYMITIGPDGTMRALRQVLTPACFAQITPGMAKADVRHALGRPARTLTYALKPDEEHWEWRWRDGMQSKVFTVTFGPTGRVVSTAIADDPREFDRN